MHLSRYPILSRYGELSWLDDCYSGNIPLLQIVKIKNFHGLFKEYTYPHIKNF